MTRPFWTTRSHMFAGCIQSGTGFPDGRGFGKCVPEFAFGMGRSFPLRCFAESASHSGRSKRDTLSQRRSNGKLRPIIRSRNGMHFPNESKTGKCIPQSALKVGRRFPMRLKRKMHPGIGVQSGMRFPREARCGKRVPECAPRMGHSFRKKALREASPRSELKYRDAASPASRTRRAACG